MSQDIQEQMRSPREDNLAYIHNAYKDMALPDVQEAAPLSNDHAPATIQHIQLVPQAYGEEWVQRAIPTKKQGQQGQARKGSQSGGAARIRASEEAGGPHRWEGIVDSRCGKAKMNLFLD